MDVKDFKPGTLVTLKDGSTTETAKVVSCVYASAFGTAQLQTRLDHALRFSYIWPRDKLKAVSEGR